MSSIIILLILLAVKIVGSFQGRDRVCVWLDTPEKRYIYSARSHKNWCLNKKLVIVDSCIVEEYRNDTWKCRLYRSNLNDSCLVVFNNNEYYEGYINKGSVRIDTAGNGPVINSVNPLILMILEWKMFITGYLAQFCERKHLPIKEVKYDRVVNHTRSVR
jgi:hypothetical protein